MCIRDRDKATVMRARKIQKFLSQPFFVAETFTGIPGKYVGIVDKAESHWHRDFAERCNLPSSESTKGVCSIINLVL